MQLLHLFLLWHGIFGVNMVVASCLQLLCVDHLDIAEQVISIQ
jgi:hypothetical protein